MQLNLSFESPPADDASTYERMKADMRNVVALLNAAIPHAGDYFAAQLLFDDEKKTVYCIRDDPGKPTRK